MVIQNPDLITLAKWKNRLRKIFFETENHKLQVGIEKSHVNDAYCIGMLHPKHRCRPLYLKKKRRNNRILQKFYGAKYVDSRDGSIKTGKELPNGRINRNHKRDGENLHPYRGQKKSKGELAFEDNDMRFNLMMLFVMRIDFLRSRVVNITDSIFF